MAKPVGTVLHKTYPNGKFDVAVHTLKGWVIVDQHGSYSIPGEPATANGGSWIELKPAPLKVSGAA